MKSLKNSSKENRIILKFSLLIGMPFMLYPVMNVVNAQTVGPSGDVNHIATFNVKVRGMKEPATVKSSSVDAVNVTVNYFDGLGRSAQQVDFRASPNRLDIVQPATYDPLGWEPVKYLPYVDGITGGYKDNALGDPEVATTDPLEKYRSGVQYDFYQQGGELPEDDYPYATAVFEESPLNT